MKVKNKPKTLKSIIKPPKKQFDSVKIIDSYKTKISELDERISQVKSNISQIPVSSHLEEENYSLKISLGDAHKCSDELYLQLNKTEDELKHVARGNEGLEEECKNLHVRLEAKSREFNQWRIRCKSLEAQFASAKSNRSCLQQKIAGKDNRLEELEAQLRELREKKVKESKGKSKSREINSLSLENERLKQSLESAKSRLIDEERQKIGLLEDLRDQRQIIRKYEKKIESNKMASQESIKDEMDRFAIEKENELNSMRNTILTKLDELEHIPELLKSTELRLIDAKKKAEENDKKAQMYFEQLEVMKDQVNRDIYPKIAQFEEKMICIEAEKEKMREKLYERDEAFKIISMKLEVKDRENTKLARHLEQALLELQRTGPNNVESDKLAQLSQQVGQLRDQVLSLRTERDQEARKSAGMVTDLEMQLERSNSLNKSLNDYVDFLRNTCEGMRNSDPEYVTSPSPQKYPHSELENLNTI